MLQNAAALPSLSQDPAWKARQESILAALGVACALMLWLGAKKNYLLAAGVAVGALVYVLRELRTLEHMARVTPPTSPVNEPGLIAPSPTDWTGASTRPTFTLSGGALLGQDGAVWTPHQIATQYGEILLLGHDTPEFWLAVEQLNRLGVHVLGGGAPL